MEETQKHALKVAVTALRGTVTAQGRRRGHIHCRSPHTLAVGK